MGPPSAAARPSRMTVALSSETQAEFSATCCIDYPAVLSMELHGDGQESAGEEPERFDCGKVRGWASPMPRDDVGPQRPKRNHAAGLVIPHLRPSHRLSATLVVFARPRTARPLPRLPPDAWHELNVDRRWCVGVVTYELDHSPDANQAVG